MSFYLSWDFPVVRRPETKSSQSEQLPYTTTAYIQTTTSHVYLTTINNSQVKQTTEDMTTYIQTITYHTHSSILNTTEKHNMTNRNKILITLIISLIFISLCIGLSYFMFIYFSHYLHTKSIIKQDQIVFNRKSFISSEDSFSDTHLNTCKTKNSILSKTIEKKNEQKRSSTNSIKLFMY
jgi:hypothetical protein